MVQTDEERKAKAREYYQENKVKVKERNQRPETKAKARERQRKPQYKAKARERQRKPEYKKYYKDYRERNEDKIHKWHKQNRLKVKTDVLTHYSRKLSHSEIPCCRCCGFNDFLTSLEIDHITNRKNSNHKKGLAGLAMYTYLKNEGFPSGYQVLCANCNSAKGDSGKCPHERTL